MNWSNDNSWIPINRKIFNHEFWNEHRTYSKAEAWIDLIQSARFEATQGKMLIGVRVITYDRGELVASIRFLSGRWNWGIGKVTRFLDLLEEEEMIERRISFGQTIVKLTNYKYHNFVKVVSEQQTERKAEHLDPLPEHVLKKQRNTKRNTKRNDTDTLAEHQRYNTNKVNKENNVKKGSNNKRAKKFKKSDEIPESLAPPELFMLIETDLKGKRILQKADYFKNRFEQDEGLLRKWKGFGFKQEDFFDAIEQWMMEHNGKFYPHHNDARQHFFYWIPKYEPEKPKSHETSSKHPTSKKDQQQLARDHLRKVGKSEFAAATGEAND
jgi:hypothetical protein